MNLLELVQMTHREAGITQSNPEPETVEGLTGVSFKIVNWVKQAWTDLQIENDQGEFVRAWFSVTCNPRFYFDLGGTGQMECFAGDTLTGATSGCTLTVTDVIIVNNGLWADGTAQGFIEYENLTGLPIDSETLTVGGANSCRFIRWGDYKLDSQTEMGDGYISNLIDMWWDSLIIHRIGEDTTEKPLVFMNYSLFLQRYEVNQTPGFPVIATETPDGGTRLYLSPPPSEPVRIRGYYYKSLTDLDSDEDEPVELKPLYHQMIAWRALMYYGQFMQQPQIEAQARSRYALFKKKFDREGELPVIMVPVRLW